MIKTSKVSLKFSNTGKHRQLEEFRQEYLRVTQFFIDYWWNEEKIPKFVSKPVVDKFRSQTWLMFNAIQACAKQAAGIVRATKQKNKQRQYIHDLMVKNGEYKNARKLQIIIDKTPNTKPIITHINPQLRKYFVNINFNVDSSFDGWIIFSGFKWYKKIRIPFRRTEHFNKLLSDGYIINPGSFVLSQNSISFTFQKPDIPIKTEGTTLGIDIGIKSIYSASSGQQSTRDKHGWNLDLIAKKMQRQKKGSKNFQKSQAHRKNHINWAINQADLNGVKTVRMEKIKNLRKGRKTSGYLSRWTYTEIFDKWEDRCAGSGVQIEYRSPTYTSQRCSSCGWTRKGNRRGEKFKCNVCGFTANSDLNASMNIALDLPEISREKRLKQDNRAGFYWNVLSKAPTVPCVQRA